MAFYHALHIRFSRGKLYCRDEVDHEERQSYHVAAYRAKESFLGGYRFTGLGRDLEAHKDGKTGR